ncbi:hypothetical protein A2803_01210 [Candidatus Woesebacteria bacterium RIFCSPHIGHO2_01_FULL_44_21]|uniref:Uncharacterized protein n=1 Tax=Candidatus Woesebacteria bacterium RIFCSPHIGHO2_01_FULL_44_21 TaxID=1802503 RepID=A0A1F7YZF0_9BACT|nr:MAG: hypothetical protein A2803_01210 [Candidatus Woesebacteria bacterium RIFCSPHIGHO2_01_FULL_44_21]OGM70811.1 MAG: hypothetical protein A2897_05200 [Candidatus Woesebacteria bacterium RIFCSPLOWO2_01_FULL_44_24b]
MKVDIKTKLDSLCAKRDLSESDVSYLMVLVRKYLEFPNMEKKREFIPLKFFCDWTLHISIEHSIPAMEMLVKLNDTIVRLKQVPDNNLLMKEITKVVSFPILKDQLHKFLTFIGVKDELTTKDSNWTAFLENYVEIIRDQVITFPDQMNSENWRHKVLLTYYNKIKSNPIKKGCWTIGLSLSLINENFFKGISIPSQHFLFCLILYSSDTTKIVIPLARQEMFQAEK